ncbi:Aste57867_2770 [Aphanomyces stellatus]|uniref:Aste57867_2770 protein n=1 Tax=Aphanomyces stellatus TaxID=120398 RepID=A0A485KCI9_9STRA|nr:hypothetical protein As57867_002763 [Aphanomyces stellatus]VFT79960.1 Aste57867_2770 [Aphanomyces stellatus]
MNGGGRQTKKIMLVDDSLAAKLSTPILATHPTTTEYDNTFTMLVDDKRDSPIDSPVEESFGALRPGGALHLRSMESIALLSQYSAGGMMQGGLEALQYPLYQNYLRMQGYQSAAYLVLVGLGYWSKIFFGFLSDCFPLLGYHRRSYMVLGWTICTLCCAIMWVVPFPAPYYGVARLVGQKPADIDATDRRDHMNEAAPNQAALFVVLSMVASLGYVMAIAASDAMVVHYAQREPIAIRGRIQTAIYLVRDVSFILPRLVVGFCMNDFHYQGTFSWAMHPNTFYGLLLVPSTLGLGMALLAIVEATPPRVPVRVYLATLWHLAKKRVLWQLCAFKLLHMTFTNYYTPAINPVKSTWFHVETLTDVEFFVATQVTRGLTMYFVGRLALNWSWRPVIVVATLATIALDATWKFVGIWDVVRSQHFQLAQSIVTIPFTVVVFLFTNYIFVEVADVGNEGTVFALISTFGNMGVPLGMVLAKLVDSNFDVSKDAIKHDDAAVRWQVTYAFAITFAVKAASMFVLVLLPPQKAYVQLLKRHGGSSAVAGVVLVVVFVCTYVFCILTSLLSIYKSTSCLTLAGGRGCNPKTT